MTQRLKIILAVLALLLVGVGVAFYSQRSAFQSETLSVPLTKPPQVPELVPTLSVWGYGDAAEERFWKESVAQLEGELSSVVLLQWYPGEAEYFAALRAALSRGEGPDFFMTNIQEAEVLYRANLLTPLILSEEEAISWVPATLQAFRRGEEVLALPSSFSVLVLYYNTRLFDRRGMAYPDDHWDWDGFLAVARGMYQPKDESPNGAVYGMELPLRWEYWNALCGQMGGAIYGPELEMDRAVTQPAARSLQQLIDWVQQYSVVTTYSGFRQKTSFESGQAAMIVAGAELMPRLREIPELKWGVASLPKAKQEATTLQVQAWAVSGRTRFRDRAYQAIQFLAQRAPLNTRLAAWKPSTVLLMTPPTARFYAETAQVATLPPHPLAPALHQMIDQQLQDLAGQTGALAPTLMEELDATLKKHPQWKP